MDDNMPLWKDLSNKALKRPEKHWNMGYWEATEFKYEVRTDFDFKKPGLQFTRHLRTVLR